MCGEFDSRRESMERQPDVRRCRIWLDAFEEG